MSTPVRAVDHDVDFIVTGEEMVDSEESSVSRYAEGLPGFARVLERSDDGGIVAESVKGAENSLGYSSALSGLGSQSQQVAYSPSGIIRWSTGRDLSRLPAILERVVANFSETLGRQHLATLSVLRLLAEARGESGDISGAIEILDRLVADLSSTFGPVHPETQHAHESLARWGQVRDLARGASQTPWKRPDG
ncbi:tetratricopeptide repeat protein [Micromonospora rifamycinica]|uniref:tetratricopeptide repeat protein n=1 Tax=Micromonospora rifamycinica TaxID=291594 RepID=UPI0033CC2066